MQPIKLSLKPNPETTQPHQCQAFALIFSSVDLCSDSLVNALADISSNRVFQGGKVFLLPRSRDDLSAQGLVWIGNTEQAAHCPAGAIALQPLVRDESGGINVWIPQDSHLQPNIDASLLSHRLMLSSFVRVWLPSIGLVGLEPEDQVSPVDWLVPPDSGGGESWKSPPDVWSLPDRMIEIGMLSPPSAEEFIKEVEQEIGKQSWNLFQSDPTGEKTDSPGTFSRLQQWFLSKLDKLAGGEKTRKEQADSGFADSGPLSTAASAGAAGAGAVGKGLAMALGVVTAPVAAAMSKLLQGQRDRQIHKLLNMLQTNPDQAMKFAIPLGAVGAAFRGFAIPGAALLARLTDFSLSSLGGAGGAVDFWDINYQLQFKLQQKYREQANREIAAGRYRRAAYIYAHLLSDFRAAATTLEKGKYFHEAAVLYRDKVRNKTDAARCLTLAGQFQAASDLYVTMNKFVEAGEVWLEANQSDKAKQMFQNAYQQQITKGAIVSAATILDQRLDRREDAISLLRRQWPSGTDQVRCVETAIAWLGEDGRHEDTKDFIGHLMLLADDHQLVDVAHITRNAANKYPDNQVRIAAEDLCRLSVSRALENGSPMERSNVLSTLAILDKDDLQLRRDANGYARGLGQRDRLSGMAGKRTGQSLTLTPLDKLSFHPDSKYIDYLIDQEQVYALATKLYAQAANEDLMFIVHMPDMGTQHHIHSIRALIRAGALEIGRADAFLINGKTIRAYGPVEDQVTSPTYGTVIQPKRDVMAAVAKGEWIWELCRTDTGILLRNGRSQTYGLTAHWVQAWQETGYDVEIAECQSFDICLSGDSPVVALDSHLFALRRGHIVRLATLGGSIHSLGSSMDHTVARVAVAHHNGLDVVFTQTGVTMNVCAERGYFLCQWAPNGRLLAWSHLNNGSLHCFEYRNNAFTKAAEVQLPSPKQPVRLLRLTPDTIGVAYANGVIERYRLP